MYNWTWIPLLTVAGVLLPLLFPTGRVLSPAWGKVAWLSIGAALLGITGQALTPGRLESFPLIENPLGMQGLPDGLEWVGLIALMGLALASGASQFLRYRRAASEERHQIKWFAFAAALVGCCFIVSGLAEGPLYELRQPIATTMLLSMSFVPIAAAIAVLRYRLYEIDFLINRTFVYVPLTALLAGVYVAMSGLLGGLLQEVTAQGSEASAAVSTLTVVALLTPLKNQFQAVVDRRFKEAPDPAKELNRLRDQARAYAEVADLDQFIEHYLEQLALAFGASGSKLRLTAGEEYVYASGDEPLEMRLEAPLTRGGRLVGTLGISARPDAHPYSHADDAALQEYAAVAAQVISLHSRAVSAGR
jgi:hypothetical protein